MDELERLRQKKLKELMEKMSGKKEETGKPIEVDSKSFNKILASNENVVVDFYADWCAPCKMVAPIIEELAKEYAGKVVFAKLNADENIEIAQRFAISAIPTIIFFKNGKPVDQIVGAMPKAEFKRWIDKNI
ncbi:thioredoxin [Archaeoglobales archaeon]|nr:MAG: thioredoxin [Archaeoglobales archaeon]